MLVQEGANAGAQLEDAALQLEEAGGVDRERPETLEQGAQLGVHSLAGRGQVGSSARAAVGRHRREEELLRLGQARRRRLRDRAAGLGERGGCPLDRPPASRR